MIMPICSDELKAYVGEQLDHFFPDHNAFSGNDVDVAMRLALERIEYCFQHISIKSYCDNGNVKFNYLYSDQYAIFLYYLSNSLYQVSQNVILCNKIFNLNKALNGLCVMYDTLLPDIFYLGHTTGTTIGRATYGDFLVVVENVHIGPAKLSSPYPIFGKGCSVLVGAKVFGGTIGDGCTIGADVFLREKNLPANSTVYRDESGVQRIRSEQTFPYAQHYFNVPIF